MLTKKGNSMRVLMAFIAMIFFTQLLSGCVASNTPPKSTEQTLYASLASATSVYNSTHNLVTQLGAAGKLNLDQKIEIKAYMVEAEMSLRIASVALEAYISDGTDINHQAFNTQILVINQLVIQITGAIGGTI